VPKREFYLANLQHSSCNGQVAGDKRNYRLIVIFL